MFISVAWCDSTTEVWSSCKCQGYVRLYTSFSCYRYVRKKDNIVGSSYGKCPSYDIKLDLSVYTRLVLYASIDLYQLFESNKPAFVLFVE